MHRQPVPRARSVIPGAQVRIVLKADQPTGRLSIGTIRDVLTRGDHPRGIKVRLTDGRVGRVQSLVAESRPQSELSSTDADYVDRLGEEASAVASGGSCERWDERARGRRDRAPPAASFDAGGGLTGVQQALGLDAFVKPAKGQRRRGRRRVDQGGKRPGSDEGELVEGGGVKSDISLVGWETGTTSINAGVQNVVETGTPSPALASALAPKPGTPTAQETVAQTANRPVATCPVSVCCPVCGDFEGDERAVAHHVATHFDQ